MNERSGKKFVEAATSADFWSKHNNNGERTEYTWVAIQYSIQFIHQDIAHTAASTNTRERCTFVRI